MHNKVLIVDDEPSIVLAINHLLTTAGYTTDTAENGVEALEKVQQFYPDLMVLDVMMPKMDGFSVALKLRENPTHHALRILFLTAKISDKDRFNGYASGADHYLTKPFDNDELLLKVQQMLEE